MNRMNTDDRVVHSWLHLTETDWPWLYPCSSVSSALSVFLRFAACMAAACLQSVAVAQEPMPDDPFRWLEDRNDPRTQEFYKSQSAAAADSTSREKRAWRHGSTDEES
jgi:non-ribosomal peptide synthetase component F